SAASRSLPSAALWKRSTLTLPPVFAATSSAKPVAVREAERAGGDTLAQTSVSSGDWADAARALPSPTAPAAPTVRRKARRSSWAIGARGERSGALFVLRARRTEWGSRVATRDAPGFGQSARASRGRRVPGRAAGHG